MAKQNAFVKGLIEKYKKSLRDERGLQENLHRAQKAYEDNREIERLCAALLRKENVDPDGIRCEVQPAATQSTVGGSAEGTTVRIVPPRQFYGGGMPDAPNGQPPTGVEPTAPINATHAVYLMMRAQGNPGFTPAEIVSLSKQTSMPLTSRDIHKVIWTQVQKKRMEQIADGKYRLTAEGEAFSNFRKKPEAEAVLVPGPIA